MPVKESKRLPSYYLVEFLSINIFLLLRLWNVDFQASKRDKNDETAGTLFL